MDRETGDDCFDAWMRAMLSQHRNALATQDDAPPRPNNNAPKPYGALEALTAHVAEVGRAALSATDTSDNDRLAHDTVMRAGLDALDLVYGDHAATTTTNT
ncbi:hypothetical protein psal_cds_1096 [Pandoravirus salinus]|uniref:Uncharacterized protein n=1 Tax=Pandoravirus salinus TaxID=1349410 RepID=S4W3R1_9VIRU|nr:hypothetical protein psal_cds_1096 [Pandoravirus salinus]AGO85317.1 hypothetical protein psal_cds_1096 [Pandoravirus salinus]